MKTNYFFLETIPSRKRISTTTINRISLRSNSLKKCRISQPININNIINNKKIKDTVQKKLLFNKYSDSYQKNNKIK